MIEEFWLIILHFHCHQLGCFSNLGFCPTNIANLSNPKKMYFFFCILTFLILKYTQQLVYTFNVVKFLFCVFSFGKDPVVKMIVYLCILYSMLSHNQENVII